MKIWLLGSSDPSIDINAIAKSNALRDVSAAQARGGARGGGERAAGVGAGAGGGGGLMMGVSVARWRAYMESYVLHHATELVSDEVRGKMGKVYLNRCVYLPYPSQ